MKLRRKQKTNSENGDDKTNALKVPGKPDVQASSAAEGDDSEMLPDSGDAESGFAVPFADSKTLVKFEFKGAVEESKISGEGSSFYFRWSLRCQRYLQHSLWGNFFLQQKTLSVLP